MARILIVDDSPTQIMTMTKILEKDNHEIFTADDGEKGVEEALKQKPDLVLMDVVMPKLNGFQATRKITTNDTTKHIPVILVTTKSEETDVIWGKRQGASDYILKPIDEAVFKETVNKYLS